VRRAFDLARAGGTAQRSAASVAHNEVKSLRWVVRGRSWFSHAFATPSAASTSGRDSAASSARPHNPQKL
jgi:hypothetical protein